jgi:hypothetical protein
VNVRQRIERIKAECSGGIGSRTIEPDKPMRMIGELCSVLLELVEPSATQSTGCPGDSPGPDQVEGRHRTDNDVTRAKRGKPNG